MGKNALAFVAGLGGGYLQAQQRQQEQDRQDKLDKIQTDRAAREQTTFDQQQADSRTLRDAARPATVQEGAGGMLRPDTMDNRDVGLPENADLPNGGLSPQAFRVNGQGYDAQAPALAAAKTYNSPESLRTRQAAAFDQIGRPDQAMSLQSAQTAQQQSKIEFDAKQAAAARQMKEEGILDAANAARRGNPQEVFDVFNRQGKSKLSAVPTMRPVERDIPGVGKVMTYDYEGTVIGEDGASQPIKINSHDLLMQTMPYQKFLEQQAAIPKTQAEIDKLKAEAADHNAAAGQKQLGGGKMPVGYRYAADGRTLEFIPGGPADKTATKKPLPPSLAKGMLDNQINLRRAETALALAQGQNVDGIEGDPDATGKKGWVPNQVLNRVDPKGVGTRAAIADLGSLVIHDRSGAAVTASEFPRLAPFIPSEKDDAPTVKKKLEQFVRNYRAVIDDATSFHEDSGYKVPKLGEARAKKTTTPAGQPISKPPAELPRAATPGDAMKLPSGTVFVDANGITRTRP